MRRPTFAVLGLLFLAPSLTTAAPHDTAPSPYNAGTTYAPTHNASPRPWRRLSDAIIRKIWKLPADPKSLDSENAPTPGNALGDRLAAQYSEDLVLRFTIRTPAEASALAKAADVLFLDIWEFNQDWADLRISKDVVPSLLGLLPPSLHQSHEALLQDVGLAQAIRNSYPAPDSTPSHHDDRFSPNLRPSPRTGKGHVFFQDYQPLSVINPWMSLMASMFTTHVRRINIGISYEGRDIPALRLGVHPTNNEEPRPPRKTILITGGLHAREWISTSTVNYLAWSFITSYGKDREMTRLLEEFDFVFVPTLNPDGYVYTWEADRLWRKNRQPTRLRFCRGVDLDRSYSYMWDGDSSQSNPCSESFPGDAPFEGVEAARFAEWAKNETENNNVDIVGLLDLHSYSQQILYPYSYSCDEEPPAIEDLEELALGLAKAIRVSRKGQTYKVTSACEGNVAFANGKKTVFPRIESTGGSALDFFYHEMKVKYSYQVKLRDTGSYGFLLPKENIVPTGEEMLDALLYFGRYMLGGVGINKQGQQVKDAELDKDWVVVSKESDVDGAGNEPEIMEL
ncbi:putative metallocarboxypeptidase ECM14 [Stemphylium lycopersici]|uniref:Inactive metallocarboxypeptidase ECM14 n=1 Tax=Stemphylium lycopersici TaxID=183478 RepID=A0A364N9J1_STELY|nr:carboxypeptidase b precursor [Stemphylium lycopersici]RAR00669.1 putative metallocarboxypeptidase ECM14 [Stemphylium lycopersici]RAR13833.1 metallocarboxypeptidase ECM14 [Stemphylium lycopersici]